MSGEYSNWGGIGRASSPLSLGFAIATTGDILKLEAAAGVGAAAGATFVNTGSFTTNLTSWQGGLGGFSGFFLGVALTPQVMVMMGTARDDRTTPMLIPYVICSGVMLYLQASPGAIIGACAGVYAYFSYAMKQTERPAPTPAPTPDFKAALSV